MSKKKANIQAIKAADIAAILEDAKDGVLKDKNIEKAKKLAKKK